ncbi:MAG TPA: hypothetical protein PK748_11025 [Acidimicrobiales bacterium]|jgi:hypothetical protein|nr:hypothetical protein [Acidimicrobiales bacterium]HMS88318.1 hypothetical protein [Acidimicrobiales bacterium]HRA35456.1 hypothetical protein [Acidimicrobiales bacterium]
MSRIRLLALVAVLVLVASACRYQDRALSMQSNGEPVPWWCHPTEEIAVTDGPAAGSVDWYAGTHKGALSWADCLELSALLDQARDYAVQWPTTGAAVADGWRLATPYVPGMGTHHVRGGVTPAMLVDPSFNRLDPILDAVGLDDEFDPAVPEVLQFEGTGASARLVGFDYYVRTDTGLPPEGFEGNNDWWHHHPWICFRTTDAAMVRFNASDATCSSLNGVNVNMSNYYMLHVWVLEDMVYTPDVYAGMMPCITGGTAIHDPLDPCHITPHAAGADPGAGAGAHDMHTMEVGG